MFDSRRLTPFLLAIVVCYSSTVVVAQDAGGLNERILSKLVILKREMLQTRFRLPDPQTRALEFEKEVLEHLRTHDIAVRSWLADADISNRWRIDDNGNLEQVHKPRKNSLAFRGDQLCQELLGQLRLSNVGTPNPKLEIGNLETSSVHLGKDGLVRLELNARETNGIFIESVGVETDGSLDPEVMVTQSKRRLGTHSLSLYIPALPGELLKLTVKYDLLSGTQTAIQKVEVKPLYTGNIIPVFGKDEPVGGNVFQSVDFSEITNSALIAPAGSKVHFVAFDPIQNGTLKAHGRKQQIEVGFDPSGPISIEAGVSLSSVSNPVERIKRFAVVQRCRQLAGWNLIDGDRLLRGNEPDLSKLLSHIRSRFGLEKEKHSTFDDSCAQLINEMGGESAPRISVPDLRLADELQFATETLISSEASKVPHVDIAMDKWFKKLFVDLPELENAKSITINELRNQYKSYSVFYDGLRKASIIEVPVENVSNDPFKGAWHYDFFDTIKGQSELNLFGKCTVEPDVKGRVQIIFPDNSNNSDYELRLLPPLEVMGEGLQFSFRCEIAVEPEAKVEPGAERSKMRLGLVEGRNISVSSAFHWSFVLTLNGGNSVPNSELHSVRDLAQVISSELRTDPGIPVEFVPRLGNKEFDTAALTLTMQSPPGPVDKRRKRIGRRKLLMPKLVETGDKKGLLNFNVNEADAKQLRYLSQFSVVSLPAIFSALGRELDATINNREYDGDSFSAAPLLPLTDGHSWRDALPLGKLFKEKFVDPLNESLDTVTIVLDNKVTQPFEFDAETQKELPDDIARVADLITNKDGKLALRVDRESLRFVQFDNGKRTAILRRPSLDTIWSRIGDPNDLQFRQEGMASANIRFSIKEAFSHVSEPNIGRVPSSSEIRDINLTGTLECVASAEIKKLDITWNVKPTGGESKIADKTLVTDTIGVVELKGDRGVWDEIQRQVKGDGKGTIRIELSNGNAGLLDIAQYCRNEGLDLGSLYKAIQKRINEISATTPKPVESAKFDTFETYDFANDRLVKRNGGFVFYDPTHALANQDTLESDENTLAASDDQATDNKQEHVFQFTFARDDQNRIDRLGARVALALGLLARDTLNNGTITTAPFHGDSSLEHVSVQPFDLENVKARLKPGDKPIVGRCKSGPLDLVATVMANSELTLESNVTVLRERSVLSQRKSSVDKRNGIRSFGINKRDGSFQLRCVLQTQQLNKDGVLTTGPFTAQERKDFDGELEVVFGDKGLKAGLSDGSILLRKFSKLRLLGLSDDYKLADLPTWNPQFAEKSENLDATINAIERIEPIRFVGEDGADVFISFNDPETPLRTIGHVRQWLEDVSGGQLTLEYSEDGRSVSLRRTGPLIRESAGVESGLSGTRPIAFHSLMNSLGLKDFSRICQTEFAVRMSDEPVNGTPLLDSQTLLGGLQNVLGEIERAERQLITNSNTKTTRETGTSLTWLQAGTLSPRLNQFIQDLRASGVQTFNELDRWLVENGWQDLQGELPTRLRYGLDREAASLNFQFTCDRATQHPFDFVLPKQKLKYAEAPNDQDTTSDFARLRFRPANSFSRKAMNATQYVQVNAGIQLSPGRGTVSILKGERNPARVDVTARGFDQPSGYETSVLSAIRLSQPVGLLKLDGALKHVILNLQTKKTEFHSLVAGFNAGQDSPTLSGEIELAFANEGGVTVVGGDDKVESVSKAISLTLNEEFRYSLVDKDQWLGDALFKPAEGEAGGEYLLTSVKPNPRAVGSSMDGLMSDIRSKMEGQLSSKKIPLIGREMGRSLEVLDELTAAFSSLGALPNNDEDELSNQVLPYLQNALGHLQDEGFLIPTEKGDFLNDRFNLNLTKTLDRQEIPLDLGLDGIGMKFDQAKVVIETHLRVRGRIGVSEQDGVFLAPYPAGESVSSYTVVGPRPYETLRNSGPPAEATNNPNEGKKQVWQWPYLQIFVTARLPEELGSANIGPINLHVTTLPLQIPSGDAGGPDGAKKQACVVLEDGAAAAVRIGFEIKNDDARAPTRETKIPFDNIEVTAERIKFGAGINLGLGLVAQPKNDNLPRVRTSFGMQWCLADKSISKFNTDDLFNLQVTFGRIELNVGDVAREVLGPVVQELDKVCEPVKELVDRLKKPLPGIGALGGNITLLDIVTLFCENEQQRTSVLELVDAIDQVGNLSQKIDSLGAAEWVALEDLIDGAQRPFSFSISGRDAVDPTKRGCVSLRETSVTADWLPKDSDWLYAPPPIDGKTVDSTKSSMGSTKIAIPILEKPQNALRLLLGQDITLIGIRLPKMEFAAEYSQFFPIIGPVGARFGGEVKGTVDLGFGFDTYGLTDPDANFFDGFYVADTAGFDGEGSDIPEVTFTAGIYGTCEINIVIARAGAGGGLYMDVTFNLHDNNGDGKVRFKELEQNWKLGPIHIFDVGGRIYGKVFAYYEIGFRAFGKFIRIAGGRFEREQTLASFDIPRPTPSPEASFYLVDSQGVLRFSNPSQVSRAQIWKRGGQYVATAVDSQNRTRSEPEIFSGIKSIDIQGSDLPNHFEIGKADELLDIPVKVHGGKGNDVISVFAAVGAEINGGDNDDTLNGTDGNDTINGGAGNDMINGGFGNDTINGEGDADTIHGDDGDDTITGGDGNDELYGDSGDDTIEGGDGIDTIDGGRNNDKIFGDGNNDTLRGGSGSDVIVGGEGEDRIEGQEARDILIGADVANGVRNTLKGTDFDTLAEKFRDEAYKLEPPFKIAAGDKKNTIIGGIGADYIVGGDGVDEIFGGLGPDRIYGMGGADKILGNEGYDRIWGGNGNDFLYGNESGDQIVGGEGADHIYATSNKDDAPGSEDEPHSIWGDLAYDLSKPKNETKTRNADRIYARGKSAMRIVTGDGNNLIFAGAEDGKGCEITCGDGNDKITALGKVNVIRAGWGENTVETGTGDDTVFAGVGDFGKARDNFNPAIRQSKTRVDFDYSDAKELHDVARNVVSSSDGNDFVVTGAGTDEIRLIGTGSKVVFSSVGNDEIRTGDGADRIFAGSGEDEVHSGGGDDLVVGQEGQDRLYGEGGKDLIWGGSPVVAIEGTSVAASSRNSFTWVTELFGKENLRGPSNLLRLDESNWLKVKVGEEGQQLKNSTIWGTNNGPKIVPIVVAGADDWHPDPTNNKEWALPREKIDVPRMLSVSGDGDEDDGDIIDGGPNDDWLFGGLGEDNIYGSAGSDYIDGGTGIDNLYGDLKDPLESFTGDCSDVILGGHNNDNIHGGPGTDHLYGGDGDDFLFGYEHDGNGGQRLWGESGSDTLHSYAATALAGKDKGDEFDQPGDVLVGGDGPDYLLGNLRQDLLIGDTLGEVSGGEPDFLHGDYLNGPLHKRNTYAGNRGGADILFGDQGSDQLYGGGGPDHLFGGEDNDWLEGMDGADRLSGGSGPDMLVLDVDSRYAVLEGDHHDGHYVDRWVGDSQDDAVDILVVVGDKTFPDNWEPGADLNQARDDSITLTTVDKSTAASNPGRDAKKLYVNYTSTSGKAGFDYKRPAKTDFAVTWRIENQDGEWQPLVEQFQVQGLEGHDTIRLDISADSLALLSADNRTDLPDEERPNKASVMARPWIGVISGGPGNDVLIGCAGRDRIDGGPDHDLVYGREGDDRISGDFNKTGNAADEDILFAGTGNDDLFGGLGTNFLFAWSDRPTDREKMRLESPESKTPEQKLDAALNKILGDRLTDWRSGTAPFDLGYNLVKGDVEKGSPLFGIRRTSDNSIPEDTGINRMLGSKATDYLYGGTGIDLLYGNGGDDQLFTRHGRPFESQADQSEQWKEYAKSTDRVWYVGGSDGKDKLSIDFVTNPRNALFGRHVANFRSRGYYEPLISGLSGILASGPSGNPLHDSTGIIKNVAGDYSRSPTEDEYKAEIKKEDLENIQIGLELKRFKQSNGRFVSTESENTVDHISEAFRQTGQVDDQILAILVDSAGGDDEIRIGETVQKTVWIDAGDGDDLVTIEPLRAYLPDVSESAGNDPRTHRNDTPKEELQVVKDWEGRERTIISKPYVLKLKGEDTEVIARFKNLTIDSARNDDPDNDWYELRPLGDNQKFSAYDRLRVTTPDDADLDVVVYPTYQDYDKEKPEDRKELRPDADGYISLKDLTAKALLHVRERRNQPTIYDISFDVEKKDEAPLKIDLGQANQERHSYFCKNERQIKVVVPKGMQPTTVSVTPATAFQLKGETLLPVGETVLSVEGNGFFELDFSSPELPKLHKETNVEGGFTSADLNLESYKLNSQTYDREAVFGMLKLTSLSPEQKGQVANAAEDKKQDTKALIATAINGSLKSLSDSKKLSDEFQATLEIDNEGQLTPVILATAISEHRYLYSVDKGNQVVTFRIDPESLSKARLRVDTYRNETRTERAQRIYSDSQTGLVEIPLRQTGSTLTYELAAITSPQVDYIEEASIDLKMQVEGHDARQIQIPIPENNHRPSATELASAIEAALNKQKTKTFKELTERLSATQKGKLNAATESRPFPIDFKCLVRSGRIVIQCIVDARDEVFNERLNGESFIQLPAISLTGDGFVKLGFQTKDKLVRVPSSVSSTLPISVFLERVPDSTDKTSLAGTEYTISVEKFYEGTLPDSLRKQKEGGVRDMWDETNFPRVVRRDAIFGGNGDDRLLGGSGEDWIFGGPGNDVLCGGPDRQASDVMFGGEGDDLFQIVTDAWPYLPSTNRPGDPALADQLDGGPGWDRVLYLGLDAIPENQTDKTKQLGRDFVMLGYDRFLGRYRVATVPWIPFRKINLASERIDLEDREGAKSKLADVLGLPKLDDNIWNLLDEEQKNLLIPGHFVGLEIPLTAENEPAPPKDAEDTDVSEGAGGAVSSTPVATKKSNALKGLDQFTVHYAYFQAKDVEGTLIDTRAGQDIVHADPGFYFRPIRQTWGIGKGDVQAGASTFKHIEIRGGDGDDLLYGSAGSDTIYGDAGTDIIWAGEGDDRVLGGTEDDFLIGGERLATGIGLPPHVKMPTPSEQTNEQKASLKEYSDKNDAYTALHAKLKNHSPESFKDKAGQTVAQYSLAYSNPYHAWPSSIQRPGVQFARFDLNSKSKEDSKPLELNLENAPKLIAPYADNTKSSLKSITNIGDFNGDERDDFLIATTPVDPNTSTDSYVIFGPIRPDHLYFKATGKLRDFNQNTSSEDLRITSENWSYDVPAHSVGELNQLIKQFDISGFADVVLSKDLGVPIEHKLESKKPSEPSAIAFAEFTKTADSKFHIEVRSVKFQSKLRQLARKDSKPLLKAEHTLGESNLSVVGGKFEFPDVTSFLVVKKNAQPEGEIGFLIGQDGKPHYLTLPHPVVVPKKNADETDDAWEKRKLESTESWRNQFRETPQLTLENFTSISQGLTLNVSNIGDIDGDGFDELGIAWPDFVSFDYKGEQLFKNVPVGRLYVHTDVTPASAAKPTSWLLWESIGLGQGVFPLGDVNKDGPDEFAVTSSKLAMDPREGADHFGSHVNVFYGSTVGRFRPATADDLPEIIRPKKQGDEFRLPKAGVALTLNTEHTVDAGIKNLLAGDVDGDDEAELLLVQESVKHSRLLTFKSVFDRADSEKSFSANSFQSLSTREFAIPRQRNFQLVDIQADAAPDLVIIDSEGDERPGDITVLFSKARRLSPDRTPESTWLTNHEVPGLGLFLKEDATGRAYESQDFFLPTITRFNKGDHDELVAKENLSWKDESDFTLMRESNVIKDLSVTYPVSQRSSSDGFSLLLDLKTALPSNQDDFVTSVKLSNKQKQDVCTFEFYKDRIYLGSKSNPLSVAKLPRLENGLPALRVLFSVDIDGLSVILARSDASSTVLFERLSIADLQSVRYLEFSEGSRKQTEIRCSNWAGPSWHRLRTPGDGKIGDQIVLRTENAVSYPTNGIKITMSEKAEPLSTKTKISSSQNSDEEKAPSIDLKGNEPFVSQNLLAIVKPADEPLAVSEKPRVRRIDLAFLQPYIEHEWNARYARVGTSAIRSASLAISANGGTTFDRDKSFVAIRSEDFYQRFDTDDESHPLIVESNGSQSFSADISDQIQHILASGLTSLDLEILLQGEGADQKANLELVIEVDHLPGLKLDLYRIEPSPAGAQISLVASNKSIADMRNLNAGEYLVRVYDPFCEPRHSLFNSELLIGASKHRTNATRYRIDVEAPKIGDSDPVTDIDSIFGEAGNDFIAGNGGADRLYGGPGDNLVIGEASESRGWANLKRSELDPPADQEMHQVPETEDPRIWDFIKSFKTKVKEGESEKYIEEPNPDGIRTLRLIAHNLGLAYKNQNGVWEFKRDLRASDLTSLVNFDYTVLRAGKAPTGQPLAPLEYATNLESLSAAATQLSAAQLKPLKPRIDSARPRHGQLGTGRLRYLNLDFNAETAEELIRYRTGDELESDPYFLSLSDFEQLRYLSLMSEKRKATSNGLPQLKTLKQLRWLNLVRKEIIPTNNFIHEGRAVFKEGDGYFPTARPRPDAPILVDANKLGRMISRQELPYRIQLVEDVKTENDPSWIASLKNLRHLRLAGRNFHDTDVPYLTDLSNLVTLDLRDNFLTDLTPLAGVVVLDDDDVRTAWQTSKPTSDWSKISRWILDPERRQLLQNRQRWRYYMPPGDHHSYAKLEDGNGPPMYLPLAKGKVELTAPGGSKEHYGNWVVDAGASAIGNTFRMIAAESGAKAEYAFDLSKIPVGEYRVQVHVPEVRNAEGKAITSDINVVESNTSVTGAGWQELKGITVDVPKDGLSDDTRFAKITLTPDLGDETKTVFAIDAVALVKQDHLPKLESLDTGIGNLDNGLREQVNPLTNLSHSLPPIAWKRNGANVVAVRKRKSTAPQLDLPDSAQTPMVIAPRQMIAVELKLKHHQNHVFDAQETEATPPPEPPTVPTEDASTASKNPIVEIHVFDKVNHAKAGHEANKNVASASLMCELLAVRQKDRPDTIDRQDPGELACLLDGTSCVNRFVDLTGASKLTIRGEDNFLGPVALRITVLSWDGRTAHHDIEISSGAHTFDVQPEATVGGKQ